MSMSAGELVGLADELRAVQRKLQADKLFGSREASQALTDAIGCVEREAGARAVRELRDGREAA